MGDQFKNPPVVIGHSRGGLIGQKYLEVHRAPAGILVAASPRGIIVTATRMTMAHPLQTLRAGWNRDTPPSSVLHGSRVNCSSPDRLPNPLSCGARRASSAPGRPAGSGGSTCSHRPAASRAAAIPAIAARARGLGITKVLEKPSAEADIIAFIGWLGG